MGNSWYKVIYQICAFLYLWLTKSKSWGRFNFLARKPFVVQPDFPCVGTPTSLTDWLHSKEWEGCIFHTCFKSVWTLPGGDTYLLLWPQPHLLHSVQQVLCCLHVHTEYPAHNRLYIWHIRPFPKKTSCLAFPLPVQRQAYWTLSTVAVWWGLSNKTAWLGLGKDCGLG